MPLGRQREVDLYEFEAILVYRETSRTPKSVTQRNPVSKKTKQKIFMCMCVSVHHVCAIFMRTRRGHWAP